MATKRDISQVIYQGKIIRVETTTATLPNGYVLEMEIVKHPGGAAVVALDEAKRVCLLRHYRYAVGEWLWELPAGKRDHGEDPSITASREVSEEAGIIAQQWDALGEVISSPGVFTERVYLYLARQLRVTPPNTAPDEVLEVHWVAFAEALSWAERGVITDAKTAMGLFRARAKLQTERSC